VRRSNVWKLIGLAGLAGVAATGAVLARNERQRRAYTPDDVRARLHEKHAALESAESAEPPTEPIPLPDLATGRRHRLARLLRRRQA
jgi:hypothetical protein